MDVRFRLSPVHDADYLFTTERQLSIAEILTKAEAPEWFWDHGAVRHNGEVIKREEWNVRCIAPDAKGVLELCVVPANKNLLPILLTVATVALTAGIGAGLLGPAGIGLFGSSFAAGGLGASFTAAAVGLGGQLLVSALTAPPSIGNQERKERSTAEAGISVNAVARFELLPVIFGRVLHSPPMLMPSYIEFIEGELWLNAAVGVEGRCLVEDPLINGQPYTEIDRAEVETKEGAPGDSAPSLCTDTVVQEFLNSFLLRSWLLVDQADLSDRLRDQDDPDSDVPALHTFKTRGNLDEFWIRFLVPGGIINTVNGEPALVPIRLEGRRVGDPDWRAFPTIHLQDARGASGQFRAEIKIKRAVYPSGVHYSYSGDQWPVRDLTAITGRGKSFQYSSDAYFQSVAGFTTFVGDLPDFTGPTSGNYTWSASSEFGAGNEAWKVGDQDGATTFWRAAANSLPATLTLTISTPTALLSYRLHCTSTPAPMAWTVEGFDGASWTLLETFDRQGEDVSNSVNSIHHLSTTAYSAYRWIFTANNGAASQDLRVFELTPFFDPAPGNVLEAEAGGATIGQPARHSSDNVARVTNCEVTPDGATYYLDPAEWDAGPYEFRLQRGAAVQTSEFLVWDYSYAGSSDATDFFTYRTSGGVHTIFIGQKNYRSDINVEATASVMHDTAPFDHRGIALVTLRVPGLQVDSISAIFTRYAREWNGSVWAETPVPTSNPAALYRDYLLGAANVDPAHGEVIDEEQLQDWFERCDAAGHECNAVVQAENGEPVLQMLASCGYASPRHANLEGVVQDYDTSAEPIALMLTPLNSRDAGTRMVWPKPVHCIIARYADEDDDFKMKEAFIYKSGYDANNATIFETWELPGFTTEAAATARASFDIEQAEARNTRYFKDVGLEGYMLRRGSVVGITDDVIEEKQSFGIIKTVTRNGSNEITSITLDNEIPWSAGQAEPEDLDDFLGGTGDTMGVAIQMPDGLETLVKDVTNTTDSNTATFATPFVDADVVAGLMVATGPTGKQFRRCRVMNIVPQSAEVWRIECADEAPELFS